MEILDRALEENNWERIADIIKDSSPTTEEIVLVLNRALLRKKWPIVRQIVGLASDNKLTEQKISTVLARASAAGEVDIVRDILNLTGDNCPYASSIQYAFERAVDEDRWDVIKTMIGLAGNETNIFFMASLLISRAIHDGKLSKIKDFINSTDGNKPTKYFIETALQYAISIGEWDIVKDILNLEGDNKPRQEAVEVVLWDAVKNKRWDLAQSIINMKGDNKPRNSQCVNAGFVALEEGVKLDISLTSRFVGHVLGFSGEPFEGMFKKTVIDFSHSRFDWLRPKDGDLSDASLHLMSIHDAKSEHLFTNFPFQTTMTCRSVACEWVGHGFSVTLLKEKDKIHIIYANRGQKEGERDVGASSENVRVYTVANDAEGNALLTGLEYALGTEDYSTISHFFARSEVKDKKNPELTLTFAKSLQKTGNCGIANTNITWHFALADEYMKKHPEVSLKQAFEATKVEYKLMRVNDRIKAFHELLTIPDEVVRDEAMIKFLYKIASKKEDIYAKKLFESLSEEEIALLKGMNITGDKVHIVFPAFDKVLEAKSAYDYLTELSESRDPSLCIPWYEKKALATAELKGALHTIKKEGGEGESVTLPRPASG